VDLENAALTIRATVGKSRREDVIPLHAQAVAVLKEIRPAHVMPDVLPTLLVFAQGVQPLTVRKDFLRAGLARKIYLNAEGNEISEAEGRLLIAAAKKDGKKPTICVKIDTADKEGRIIDLHAMRTTLGTNLARAGVVPQLAQRIMRHRDFKTTQRHYTALGLNDTAQALASLPAISAVSSGVITSTGTDSAVGEMSQPKKSVNSSVRSRAKRGVEGVSDGHDPHHAASDAHQKTPQKAGFSCESGNGPGQIRTADLTVISGAL
jgi:hypothetical protein